ncbi:MAG: hypothetical protein SNJ56_01620 [Termitinemataceae bacterium]
MEFLLHSKITKSGQLVLHIPLGLRLSIIIIGLIILLVSISPFDNEQGIQFALPSIIILCILLFGALYEERWIFDPQSETITFLFGLLFVTKKVRIQFKDIAEIKIEHSLKRGASEQDSPVQETKNPGLLIFFRPRVFVSLSLYLHTSERLVVESARSKHEKRISETAHLIASVLKREAD